MSNKILVEYKIAQEIKKMLNQRGFLINQYNSKTSNSIYITIDNGAIKGIRISNHPSNLKSNYKFNMINHFKGKKRKIINGQLKQFYNFASINSLIKDIEIERANKIIKYGYMNYQNIRNKKRTAIKKAA